MKVKLTPRRERKAKVDPFTGEPVIGKDGKPETEELLPTERAIWVEDSEGGERHIGYVDVGRRHPINILPPITIGVPQLAWDSWWIREVADEVCMQLDGRKNSRPCSHANDYVTPDEEEILEEMLAEEQAQQRERVVDEIEG